MYLLQIINNSKFPAFLWWINLKQRIWKSKTQKRKARHWKEEYMILTFSTHLDVQSLPHCCWYLFTFFDTNSGRDLQKEERNACSQIESKINLLLIGKNYILGVSRCYYVLISKIDFFKKLTFPNYTKYMLNLRNFAIGNRKKYPSKFYYLKAVSTVVF